MTPTISADCRLSHLERGRGGQDRTGDHLLPKQVRYRCATPRDLELSHRDKIPALLTAANRGDPMDREYIAWDSPTLGRRMEMLWFGHAGKPMIWFPTSAGRFYQNEDFGLVG